MSVQVFTPVMNINTGNIITANYANSQIVSNDQLNVSGRGAIVTLNLAATNPGLEQGNVSVIVEGKSSNGTYYPLLVGAPVATKSQSQTLTYTVHPTAPTILGQSATSPLPLTWRVRVVHNNNSHASYTVGASITL